MEKLDVYIEKIPDQYYGDTSITITCNIRDRWKCDMILDHLKLMSDSIEINVRGGFNVHDL